MVSLVVKPTESKNQVLERKSLIKDGELTIPGTFSGCHQDDGATYNATLLKVIPLSSRHTGLVKLPVHPIPLLEGPEVWIIVVDELIKVIDSRNGWEYCAIRRSDQTIRHWELWERRYAAKHCVGDSCSDRTCKQQRRKGPHYVEH